MIERIAYRGLTDNEYKKIKELAKKEIPFKVNIRTHKQKYAYGAIDIRPYGKGVYRWANEEFEHILDFIKRHNLAFNRANIDEKNYFLCYSDGFTYVYKYDSK